MARSEKKTAFRVEISPDALKDISRLDQPIQQRIANKIDWIATHHDQIEHYRLSNLPKHLQGLCKRREGDYRILYWTYPPQRVIKIYGIIHRSTEYKILK